MPSTAHAQTPSEFVRRSPSFHRAPTLPASSGLSFPDSSPNFRKISGNLLQNLDEHCPKGGEDNADSNFENEVFDEAIPKRIIFNVGPTEARLRCPTPDADRTSSNTECGVSVASATPSDFVAPLALPEVQHDEDSN